MCCPSFCFGLMLYVRAIVAPVESSTPSSPDINDKVRAGYDPLASFLTIRVMSGEVAVALFAVPLVYNTVILAQVTEKRIFGQGSQLALSGNRKRYGSVRREDPPLNGSCFWSEIRSRSET